MYSEQMFRVSNEKLHEWIDPLRKAVFPPYSKQLGNLTHIYF